MLAPLMNHTDLAGNVIKTLSAFLNDANFDKSEAMELFHSVAYALTHSLSLFSQR